MSRLNGRNKTDTRYLAGPSAIPSSLSCSTQSRGEQGDARTAANAVPLMGIVSLRLSVWPAVCE
jgi:hypothetical protein